MPPAPSSKEAPTKGKAIKDLCRSLTELFYDKKEGSRTGGSTVWGLVGQALGDPHSTLPGFMRPRGSSMAFSCRMVSMPTSPTSSCSSCCLPSPMPCSPVHVPWSASARLGASEEVLSRVLLPLPTSQGICSYLPSCFPKALTLSSSSGSSGSTSKMQWKLPSPTCPTMVPRGPEDRAAAPARPLPSLLHGAPAVGMRTCESRGLQVLLGLHQDLRQPGDGHAHVSGIALRGGRFVRFSPLTPCRPGGKRSLWSRLRTGQRRLGLTHKN